jgi:serine/threonine protein phosphatase PrpC
MKPTPEQCGETSVATSQGEREHQEDRAVCEWIDASYGCGWLLAVFDGHRGALTAEQASLALPSLFKTYFAAHRDDLSKTFREVFLSLHNLTSDQLTGSTASVAYIPQDARYLYWAILGDSPTAAIDAQDQSHFGPDHNIRTNMKERAAAKTRGGIYKEGYLEDPEKPDTGVQMTRVLGDADLGRVLDRTPEIQTIPLGGKGVVLVGSDGLLSASRIASEEQLAKLLRMILEGADARAVVQDALHRRTGDNATAVVWKKS